MMEMDRLVVVLDGSEDQTLVIESKDSHATMKDEGDGLAKYIQNLIKEFQLFTLLNTFNAFNIQCLESTQTIRS